MRLDAAVYAMKLRPIFTEADVQRSFRALSLRLHPDKNNGDSESFMEMHQAYMRVKESLDATSKQVHDARVTSGQACLGASIHMTTTQHSPCLACKGMGARDAADLYVCIACLGAGVTADGGRRCASCAGVGTMPKEGKQCRFCHGKRRCPEEHSVLVECPKGTPEGTEFLTASDFFIRIVYDRSEYDWSLVGDELHVVLTLSLEEALCGFERTVDTAQGAVAVRSEGCCDLGRETRIEGGGLGGKGGAVVRLSLEARPDLAPLRKYVGVFQKMFARGPPFSGEK